ncbi:uncharacterized protein LOC111899445 [Lactuca sativa]|uniref:uncharacterized protein LOC111899445 n=1 Tax=Lactuca sativa TaxID=4236 RepID=UPI000CD9BFDB|nr:uncharacterized protein LOC111899445 [Lactuca sativa]
MVKSRAFQLTVEEDSATPGVVTGSFLVNDISTFILFDSGATQSFVSLALSKRFARAPRELDFVIADDRLVQVARVHRGCILRIFKKQYPIDLVPIPLRRNKGDRAQCGTHLCLAVRAKCYIQQGCSGFVAYVMDTQDKGTTTVGDVLIVWDYPDVFPEDFPGVPPERKVEFRIYLVLGAALIAKASSRLTPPEI